MKITKGTQNSPIKSVIYGVEGIGKTTLASKFPRPLFLDCEGGTKRYDVNRIEIKTYAELERALKELSQVKSDQFDTIVIDTVDWTEKSIRQSILEKYKQTSIEQFGYGKGYVFLAEEYTLFIYLLDKLVNAGYNVVCLAHAKLYKMELPDEQGQFDRYGLKLTDSPKHSISGMQKEWADIVLFCNYKTNVIKDNSTGKSKAYGANRIMYANHTATFDAKNRFNLQDEMEMDFKHLAKLFKNTTSEEEVLSKTLSAKQKNSETDKSICESSQNRPSVDGFMDNQPQANPYADLIKVCKDNDISEKEILSYFEEKMAPKLQNELPLELQVKRVIDAMISNIDKIKSTIKGE